MADVDERETLYNANENNLCVCALERHIYLEAGAATCLTATFFVRLLCFLENLRFLKNFGSTWHHHSFNRIEINYTHFFC